MPITQTRLVQLARHADDAIRTIIGLKTLVKRLDIPAALMQMNSVIERAQNPLAAQALEQVRDTLAALNNTIAAIEIDPEMLTNIAEELAHFKANHRRNELNAAYAKRRRLGTGTSVQFSETLSTQDQSLRTPLPVLTQEMRDYLDGKIASLGGASAGGPTAPSPAPNPNSERALAQSLPPDGNAQSPQAQSHAEGDLL